MTPTIKGATKSWTIWFSAALVLFGFLQLESDHVGELISPQAWGWYNIVTGAIVAVLRFLTTMSLAEKGASPTEGDS
jgi:hypothetical protein